MTLIDRKLKLFASGLCGLWVSLGWQVAPGPAMTVTPADPTISLGQTQQFTASGARTPAGVSAGAFFTCVRLGDGTMWCWGRNADGQLGNDGTAEPQCAQTTGHCSPTPVRVGGITSPSAIAAGGYHTCALLGDGTVWCWGRNGQGQLGDGTITNSSSPVRAGAITGAVAVIGAFSHTCAVLSDGTVQCWGENAEGELGDGTSGGSSSPPVRVVGLTGAVAVSGGGVPTPSLLGGGAGGGWGGDVRGGGGGGGTTKPAPPPRG